ncbi:hypothetical protein GCM10017786_15740 [Amycolatopsis deserti]|uniref:Uncharacterized protein n=1 Tax=Amycolatopsis deserti TaxID=185696 RepID=A0ABQ3IHM8_9PSEU|nr:hypothetical protein [Amycolatopsis deserti]GHE84779.1 hypothetical protein GCM10017786_15740 [Amycolatopsis deserti]
MSHALPPRRELPPEVRERMRATVRAGMTPRPGRALAAAAAVVLLVGGVLIGVQFLRPAAPVAGAGVDDRCWAAIESAGRTGQVPPRAEWQATGSRALGDDVVTSYLAGGKPVFCETTATTVTVSDPGAAPASAPGSRTGLLLRTGTGLVAGVADPSWPRIELSLADGLGVTVEPVTPRTGVFTAFTATDPATPLWAGMSVEGQTTRPGPRAELPPAPAPLVSVVDVPGDRSSPAGRALGECLAALPEPLDGADGYQPGGMLDNGPYRVVLARSAEHTVACVTGPAGATLHRDTFIGRSIPVRRLSVPAQGGKVPFVGLVPRSATSMDADFGTGERVAVPVANGTFGAWLPEGAKPVDPDTGDAWVRVTDARGATLYNGSVMLR